MITSRPLNVAPASGVPPCTIDRHQPALHESTKVKSCCHIPTVASCLTDESSLCTRCGVHRPPPCTHPISLDHGLQVHFPTRLITASKCISKLARLRPAGFHEHGLQVHLQTRSITISGCISKSIWTRPRSVSLNTLDSHLQEHLQTRSITASEYLSEFTPSSFSGAPRIAIKHRPQAVQI